jgi:hypothetical protein
VPTGTAQIAARRHCTKARTNMLNIVKDHPHARALRALDLTDRVPFKAAPIMPPNAADPQRELLRKTHRTAVATWLYINRLEGSDRLGPLPPTYMSKADDLVMTGRRHPIQKFPPQYRSGRTLWDEADAAAATDPDHAAATHLIASLPGETPEQWRRMIEQYLDDHFAKLGMVVDYAVHAKRDKSGEWATCPHVHCLVTGRRFRNDIRKGQRQRTWLFSKAQSDAAEDAWLKATNLTSRTFA